MQENANIAVVGAAGLVGEAMVEALGKISNSIDEVFPLDIGEGAEKTVMFSGRAIPVFDIETFDWQLCKLAIFAVPEGRARSQVEAALDAGCIVLDFAGDLDITPVLVGMSSDFSVDRKNFHKYYRLPAGIASVVAPLIQVLNEIEPIQRVTIHCAQPASALGRKHMESLASQTAKMLAGVNIDDEIKQAFTIRPDQSIVKNVELDLRHLFEKSDIGFDVQITETPMFFGYGIWVSCQCRKVPEIQRIKSTLDAMDFVKIEEKDGMAPSSVEEKEDKWMTVISHVRELDHKFSGYRFWSVADNVQKGAISNTLSLVLMLLKS